MLEVKIKKEVESRCGIQCNACHFKEEQVCTGCLKITKPFWETFVLLKIVLKKKKSIVVASAKAFPVIC